MNDSTHLVQVVIRLRSEARNALRGLESINREQKKLNQSFDQGAKSAAEHARETDRLNRRFRELRNELNNVNRNLTRSRVQLKEWIRHQSETNEGLRQGSRNLKRWGGDLRTAANNVRRNRRELENTVPILAKIDGGYREVSRSIRNYTKDTRIASKQTDVFSRRQGTLERAFSRLRTAVNDSDSGFNRFRRSLGETNQSTQRLERRLALLGRAMLGLAIASVIIFTQAFASALVALAGHAIAVAGSLSYAAGVLVGSFIPAIAQAIPVVGLLIGALQRLNLIKEAVTQQDNLAATAADRDATAKERQREATNSIRDAERALSDAKKEHSQAEKDLADERKAGVKGDSAKERSERELTEAREDARAELEALKLAEQEAALAAKRSILDQQDARDELQRAIREGDISGLASARLGVQEAALGRRQAQADLREARRERGRAEARGIGGSEIVQQAREQTGATSELATAQERVRDTARGVKDAQRALAEAHREAKVAAQDQTATEAQLDTALGKLTDSEKRLMENFLKFRDRLKKVFTPITDILTDSFNRGLNRVENLVFDNKIVEGFRKLAGGMSDVVDRLTKTATDERSKRFWEFTLKEGRKNLKPLADIGEDLIRIFEKFARAAAPAFRKILFLIRKELDSLSKTDLKDLRDFFLEGVKHLRAWWNLLKSVINLIAALFGASSKQGLKSVRDLTDTLNEAADNLRENGEAAEEFFEGARKGAEEIAGIFVALGEELFKSFDPEALEAFATVIKEVLIPALGFHIRFMGEVAKIMEDVLRLPFASEVLKWSVAVFTVVGSLRLLYAVIKAGLAPIGTLATKINDLTGLGSKLKNAFKGFATHPIDRVKKAFDKLGDSARTARDRVKALATDIKNLDTDKLKARFGRGEEGQLSLIPAISPGSLKDLKGFARGLGLVGVALTVVIGAVLAFKDNWLGIRDFMEDMGRSVIQPLIDDFNDLKDSIIDLADEFGFLRGPLRFSGRLLERLEPILRPIAGLARKFADAVADLARKFARLFKEGNTVAAIIKTIGAAFLAAATLVGSTFVQAIIQPIRRAISFINLIIDGIRLFIRVMKNIPSIASDAWGIFKDAVKDALDGIGDGFKALKNVAIDAIDAILGGISTLLDGISRIPDTPFTPDVGGAAEDAKNSIDELRESLRGEEKDLKKTNKEIKAGADVTQAHTREVKRYKNEQDEATKSTKKHGEETDKTKKKVKDYGDGASKARKQTRHLGITNIGAAKTSQRLGGTIAEITNKVLKQFSVKELKFGISKEGEGIRTPTELGQTTGNFQTGGFLGRQGDRGGDSIPIMAAPGEAVLTGWDQPIVDKAMAYSAYKGLIPYSSLDEMFRKKRQSHAFAPKQGEQLLQKGGWVGRRGYQKGGMVDPAWDAGSELIAAKIANVVHKWTSKYNADITAGYEQGHMSPGHTQFGTATDVVPRGGWGGRSQALFEKGLEVLTRQGFEVGYDGSHGTLSWGGHGPPAAAGGNAHAHIEWLGQGSPNHLPGVRGGPSTIPKIKITGPKGPIKDELQGQADKLRKEANKYIGRKTGGGFSGHMGHVGKGALSPQEFIRIALIALKMTEHFRATRGNAQKLLRLAIQESSLDPNSLNNWDSNAAAGNPSGGLMHTTVSTFKQYHEPGTKNTYFDPLASIAASINYQAAQYGHLVTSSPYAKGGWVVPYGGEFRQGGIVPGRIGEPKVIVAHGGEAVIPTFQDGGKVPAISEIKPRGRKQSLKFADDDLKDILEDLADIFKDLKKGKKNFDKFAKAIEEILGEGKLMDQITEQIEELSGDLASKLLGDTFEVIKEISKGGGKKKKKKRRKEDTGTVVRVLTELEVAIQELENLEEVYRFLEEQRKALTKTMKRLRKQMKRIKNKIKDAENKEEKEQLKEDKETIETAINNTKDRLQELGGLIGENLQARWEAQLAVIEAQIGEFESELNIQGLKATAIDLFGQLLGVLPTDVIVGNLQDQINTLQEQKKYISAELEAAKDRGDTLLIQELTARLAETNNAILEAHVSIMEAYRDAAQKVIEDFEFRVSTLAAELSILVTKGELGDFLPTEQIVSNLRKQLGTLKFEEAAITKQIAKAKARGDTELVRELTTTLLGVQQAIVDTQIAIMQAYRDRVQRIIEQFEFRSGINEAQTQIRQALDTLNDTVSTSQIVSLLRQRLSILKSQLSYISQQISAAQARGDTAFVRELTQTYYQIQQAIIDTQIAIMEAYRAGVQKVIEQYEFRVNIAEARISILQALDNLNDTVSTDAIVGFLNEKLNALRQQLSYVQQQISAAQARGDTEFVRELQLMYFQIQQAIIDTQTAIMEAYRNEVTKQIEKFDFRTAIINARIAIQDTLGQLADTLFTGAIVNLLTKRLDNLRDELNYIQNELSAARSRGDTELVRQLEQQLLDIQNQILETQLAIFQAYRDAASKAIGEFQRKIGLEDIRTRILQLQGEISGVIDQAGLIALAEARKTLLLGQREEIQSQLAGAQARGDVTLVKELEEALLNNELALLENTKELMELNGQLGEPQGFTSTAWQLFRIAVFNGMGGLMPQLQPFIPSLQTGGPVTRTGLYNLHRGEFVIPPPGHKVPPGISRQLPGQASSTAAGVKQEINNYFTEPMEVADPTILANKIAFRLKTLKATI